MVERGHGLLDAGKGAALGRRLRPRADAPAERAPLNVCVTAELDERLPPGRGLADRVEALDGLLASRAHRRAAPASGRRSRSTSDTLNGPGG